jgi:hypothetical protein
MKQIIQSYKTGDLWLADVPIPACKSGGVLVHTRQSFVSAGTEPMLVDFAKKNLAGKALAMPDQVKKVLRKMQTEGIVITLEKVQASWITRDSSASVREITNGGLHRRIYTIRL